MDSVGNTQEILNATESLFAKLTIQDKHPRTTQDDMPITQDLKRLRLSRNYQSKESKMMLQKDYKHCESKALNRKLKLRRFIVNDPKRQVKKAQKMKELEKYRNQVITLGKKINIMNAEAIESRFKLFAAMHKAECLEKRVTNVSEDFEALKTFYTNDGYCPQMTRAFIRAKSITDRLKNSSQINSSTVASNYNSKQTNTISEEHVTPYHINE